MAHLRRVLNVHAGVSAAAADVCVCSLIVSVSTASPQSSSSHKGPQGLVGPTHRGRRGSSADQRHILVPGGPSEEHRLIPVVEKRKKKGNRAAVKTEPTRQRHQD